MIRPLGALALAMTMLIAYAPIESVKEKLFPPEETPVAEPQAVPSASESTATEAPPVPRRKPEAISEVTLAEADPEQLVDLDFDATKALLGDPAIKPEKPPAKVWAYDGGNCMFNLFFYPSVDDEVFRVLAYEVTDETSPAEILTHQNAEPGAHKVRDKDNPIVRPPSCSIACRNRTRDNPCCPSPCRRSPYHWTVPRLGS